MQQCILLLRIKKLFFPIGNWWKMRIIKLTKYSRRANIILLKETWIVINEALLLTMFWRSLLSFRDIQQNGYHIVTINEKDIKYFFLL